MEKIFTEIQKINTRFELMEKRLSNLERKMDCNENRVGVEVMGRSNFGVQDDPPPCSSRDVIEGDIILNERGQNPGMFVAALLQQINSSDIKNVNFYCWKQIIFIAEIIIID